MSLVYVEGGGDPDCKYCKGEGIRPVLGYGAECHCVGDYRLKRTQIEIGLAIFAAKRRQKK